MIFKVWQMQHCKPLYWQDIMVEILMYIIWINFNKMLTFNCCCCKIDYFTKNSKGSPLDLFWQIHIRQSFNLYLKYNFLLLIIRGVSGSDKTNKTKSPNQTKPNWKCIRPCLVQFKNEPNQSKPVLLGLVLGFSFWNPKYRWIEPMLTSLPILLLLSLFTHTYEYAQN